MGGLGIFLLVISLSMYSLGSQTVNDIFYLIHWYSCSLIVCADVLFRTFPCKFFCLPVLSFFLHVTEFYWLCVFICLHLSLQLLSLSYLGLFLPAFFLFQTRSLSKAAGMFSGTQEKCAACGKTAYPLEKMDAAHAPLSLGSINVGENG